VGCVRGHAVPGGVRSAGYAGHEWPQPPAASTWAQQSALYGPIGKRTFALGPDRLESAAIRWHGRLEVEAKSLTLAALDALLASGATQ
jgi:hypothetical protein